MLTATIFIQFETDPGPGLEFEPTFDQRQDILERILKEWPTNVYKYGDKGYHLIVDSITAEFDIDVE